MKREKIKVFSGTKGIYLIYDKKTDSIISSDANYVSPTFRVYPITNIIYDERMVACFFGNDHPWIDTLDITTLQFLKIFTHYGLTVIVDHTVDSKVVIVVYPHDDVKQFKSE